MYADILILVMVSAGPKHGYDIKKQVDLVMGGSVALNNKVLYPTLKRFEEMGAVQREVVRQQGKPDRHIYQITDRGIEVMQALLRDCSPDIMRNDAEFLVRVSMFDLLEPEARLEILAARAEIVHGKLAHIQQMRKLAREARANSYAEQVISFHEQQDRHELAWIQALIQEIQRTH